MLREDLPPPQAEADLAYLQAASNRAPDGPPPSERPAGDHTWNRLRNAGG
jgi:hypothetical protein